MRKNLFDENASRFLFGEMKTSEKKQFISDLKKSPGQWREFQDYLILNDVLSETLNAEAVKSGTGSVLFADFRKNRFLQTLSAGAVAAVVFLSVFLYPDDSQIRVHTVMGNCIKTAWENTGMDRSFTVESAGESACDIMFEGGRNLRIRMFPHSKVHLDRTKNYSVFSLEKGLIQSETLNSDRNRERIFLVVGKSSMEFLGTQVTAYRKDNGFSRIEVAKGRIQIQKHNTLSLKEISSGEFIKNAEKNKISGENTVEEKESVTLSDSHIKKESIPEERMQILKSGYTSLDETFSANIENNKDLSGSIQTIQKKIENPSPEKQMRFSVHLKNGQIIKGNSVYHEKDSLVIEDGNKKIRYRSSDIQKIERE